MEICRDFMHRKVCPRGGACRFIHDPTLCFHFWKHGSCKFGDGCTKSHIIPGPVSESKAKGTKLMRRPKNTETFEPMTKPVDMRIVYDLGRERLQVPLTSRDVLLVPCLFSDFPEGELYRRLVQEIEGCGIKHVLKLWHGDTHLIADDHTHWKQAAPTFRMVLDRVRRYFGMDIKATRFNWYRDTSDWKPFHHDAAAVKKDKAASQNFTVGVSFGCTRQAAFEEVESKKVVGIPLPDGSVYAFASETNVLWKHGILKEPGEVRHDGRISVIAWGWVDGIV